jgi:hypothetical protein
MKTPVLAVLMLLLGHSALIAQGERIKPELRPFVGASIPMGDQRELFANGTVFGAQVAFEFGPRLHLLGSAGWVETHGAYTNLDDQVKIFQWDLGFEMNAMYPLGHGWDLKPFLGFGGGYRHYRYRALTSPASFSLSGPSSVFPGTEITPTMTPDTWERVHKSTAVSYAALGTEFQIGYTALRLEARGNLFVYRSPIPVQDLKTRTDIGLTFGIAYHFH